MDAGRSSLAEGTAHQSMPALKTLLQKTSRTFALTIPLLPEPLQTEVATAYLLFRIIDTFEDATLWNASRRQKALALFVRLMEGEETSAIHETTAQWLEDPPLDHAGYLELLAAAPHVIEWYRQLRPAAGAALRRHVVRSARGMIDVVARTDASGLMHLETLQELRDYCFVVAGVVGQMLTELFLIQCPSLAVVAEDLRARAVEFGEGLQLVNILKDVRSDAAEGRAYLPRQASLPEVFVLARADLRRATEYTNALRTGGADKGLVAFNVLNTRLAIETLHLLRDKGPGAKLTRPQVLSVAAEVMHAVEDRGILFPDLP
jgi:farnesyl-diphosphate farnesyltransferase